jgi:hypothetical protein
MYTAPNSLPRNAVELSAAVRRELALESREPSSQSLLLTVLNAAPAKLNEGLIALADGTNWNPGHGAGPYVYQGGAWLPLYGATPAFTAPTLENSWVDYGAGAPVAGYRKDAFGVVELRGNIASGTIGASAFTLPVGYRPSATLQLPAVSYNGAAYVLGVCVISSLGQVYASIGHNNFYSFDGITFAAI